MLIINTRPDEILKGHLSLLLGLRVQVSSVGFRVQGSGFRVQGSGFRVQGVSQVQTLWFKVQTLWFMMYRFRNESFNPAFQLR